MLRILDRRSLDIGPGYEVFVLTGHQRVWVRLTHVDDRTLVRFWSRDERGTSPLDVDKLISILRDALSRAIATGAGDYSAATVFAPGWELWPAQPAPIADELFAPDFQARLARFRAEAASATAAVTRDGHGRQG